MASQNGAKGGPLVTGRAARGPSMADVAEAVGVSHQTVSRVLNNKGSVRPETRQRVLEAIAQMGYRRNEAARALASNRSRLLGIVTPRFVNFGPATTLLSLQLAANRKGYLVTVATLPEFTSGNLEHAIDELLSLGVAGLIVIAQVENMAPELEAQDIPIPTLVIASHWTSEQSSIPRVGVDQRTGVREALAHLSERGCHTVAHVAGPIDWFDAQERETAWEDGLVEFNLERGSRVQGDWSAARGYEAAQELMDSDLPDAVFAANDQTALGMLQAFSEAGVKIPEDIRLVGVDDEEGTAFYNPALTTVRQDFGWMGREAIKLLSQMIEGEEVEGAMIPSKLIKRESA